MKLQYQLSHALWYLASLLPMRVLYVVADVLIFPLLFYALKYRRPLVQQHLAQSFPQRGGQELHQIERDFYHWLSDYFVETLKEMSISRKEMMRRMTFEGLDEARAEMEAEGKPFAFLYLGHFCNWEWVASLPQWGAQDLRFGQIYHRLHNPITDRLFYQLRSRFGAENIVMKDTLRTILNWKREGVRGMIGFISDQSPGWEAMHFWTTFLHRDTSFFTGAEKIGQKVNAAYYYCDITHPRRGYYHCVVRRLIPTPAEQTTEYPITAAYVRALEASICATPHLWLWTHNRWKRSREEWEEYIKKLKGQTVSS